MIFGVQAFLRFLDTRHPTFLLRVQGVQFPNPFFPPPAVKSVGGTHIQGDCPLSLLYLMRHCDHNLVH